MSETVRPKLCLLFGVVLASATSPALLAQPAGERTIQWGFEQRVRTENWDNIMDCNDATPDLRNQIRYRTRLWSNIPLSHDIDFYVGLDQETNQIVRVRAPWRMDEVIFENAYIDFKRLFTNGLSLRVGRQNLIRGEGFLLLEGNPYDGSRSIYFNAANLAYSWKKSKLEFIGISNPKSDRYLPRFNDRARTLIERDEQALGFYYTDKNSTRTSLESYYFYKKEVHDSRLPTNPQFQPDRHVHTAGGRAVHAVTSNLSLTGELALQWGAQHPSTSIAGWGGYAYAKRQFAGSTKPYVQAGWWGFSGDDPNTKDRVEGWDPLFSRWPKWSELYLYTQFRETGVGYQTNLRMWQGEAGFTPWKPIQCRATYYHMDAFHPFPGATTIYGKGTARGDMYQGRMDFKASPNWSGHVLWEHLLPGGFYSAKTPSYFLRFEIMYQLKGSIPL
ncbi:MAG TPA: alginate export family protein [Bryobacteraceae bacterium]|nr:alginate export family protein [Bryobacteraceae bacterium]